MRLEAKKYLYDIRMAAERIARFTSGKGYEDYSQDELLRAGVERQFEIIGEAPAKLARFDPRLAEKISYFRQIIAFRNILIHGYADVDDRLVWDVIQTKLTPLVHDVEVLMDGA